MMDLADRQTLTLAWPPSVNSIWRSYRGRNILSKKGREYKNTALDTFFPYSSEDRLFVELDLYPPSRRRLDIDNHSKVAIDLLVHRGVIPDDSQIDKLLITRRAVIPPGKAVVRIQRIIQIE